MKDYVKWIIICSFVIAAGILHSCSKKDMLGEVTIRQSEESIQITEQYQSQETTEKTIYVFITGYVTNPGVYELAEDTRLFELIEKAGGFLEEAAVDALNLAEYVRDGDKIVVYSKEESVTQKTSNGTSLIDINRAEKEALMTLPGIGASRAEAIIRYREENGAFQNVEDIMKVSGIKEGAFEKIKDLITV